MATNHLGQRKTRHSERLYIKSSFLICQIRPGSHAKHVSSRANSGGAVRITHANCCPKEPSRNMIMNLKNMYLLFLFSVKRQNGLYRAVFNPKRPNRFVRHHHFKMKTLNMAVKLMKPDTFAGSLHLKDAYYSIAISGGCHTKYLKFWFRGTLYKLTLANGLKSGPCNISKNHESGYLGIRVAGSGVCSLCRGFLPNKATQSICVKSCPIRLITCVVKTCYCHLQNIGRVHANFIY